jgi:two-component system, cell cycle response regulator DivK
MNTTILVIEDNEQNLYLMRFLLESHGFTIVEARDGLEGIRTAESVLPDLILLDIQLPVMDGYTVATELRLRPALADTPIIAVTSYAMAGDRERALAAGATDYIEKPVDPDTVLERVRAHIERRRTR